jgi:hypothetical protein
MNIWCFLDNHQVHTHLKSTLHYCHQNLTMSRITNDMLLGAIVASTGIWVIGIMVVVGYLVITA